MQTAEFDVQDFHKPRAGDEKLAIRFFIKPRPDAEESAKAGHPKFKEHEYIQIMVPGDRNNILVRPLTDQDKGRFHAQYEHWRKTQGDELASGTPLEALGPNVMTLAMVEEYRYFGIRTLEQLADLRDDICSKVMGAQALKQKAQRFLEMAKDEAPMKRVQEELDKRDNTIATLQKSVEDQAALIKTLQEQINGGVKRK